MQEEDEEEEVGLHMFTSPFLCDTVKPALLHTTGSWAMQTQNIHACKHTHTAEHSDAKVRGWCLNTNVHDRTCTNMPTTNKENFLHFLLPRLFRS